MKTFSFLFLPLLWLMVIPFAFCEKATLKLGVLIDLTGKGNWLGPLTRTGAEMAVEDLKAEGIRVQLVFEDSMSDTKTAANAMNKLLLIDSVDGVYVDFSPIGVAVAPLASAAKKLMIYNGGAVSAARDNQYVFKTSIDYFKGCRLVAEHWKSQGIKKIGISCPQLEATELCLNGARTIYPDIIERNHNYGEALATQAAFFRNKGVDAVISSAFEAGLFNLIKAFTELKFTVPIGDLQTNATPRIRKENPDLTALLLTYGMPPFQREFEDRLSDRGIDLTGGNTENAALAYTHLKQLARAISNCPENDVTCEDRQLSSSPPDSTFGFEKWHERIAQIPLVLRKWEDNRWIVIQ